MTSLTLRSSNPFPACSLGEGASGLRPGWLASALLLHGLLLSVLLWERQSEPVESPPVAIQVSLLDPEPKTPAQPAPKPPEPVPQKPVPKPVVKPAPVQKPTPVPLAKTPVPNPVVASAPTPQPSAAAAEAATPPAAPVAPTTGPAAGAPVQEARFDADYLQNPKPQYPSLSRRMGEEGRVMLRAYVLPSGQPETVELKQSSGSVRLDEAALAAVRKWRFVPARRGGETVAAWVVIPITFRLES